MRHVLGVSDAQPPVRRAVVEPRRAGVDEQGLNPFVLLKLGLEGFAQGRPLTQFLISVGVARELLGEVQSRGGQCRPQDLGGRLKVAVLLGFPPAEIPTSRRVSGLVCSQGNGGHGRRGMYLLRHRAEGVGPDLHGGIEVRTQEAVVTANFGKVDEERRSRTGSVLA